MKQRAMQAVWTIAGFTVIAGCLTAGIELCAMSPAPTGPVNAVTCQPDLLSATGSAQLCAQPLRITPAQHRD